MSALSLRTTVLYISGTAVVDPGGEIGKSHTVTTQAETRPHALD